MEVTIIDAIKALINAMNCLPQLTFNIDVWKPLIEFCKSLPDYITETDVYKKANSISGKSTYENVKWVFDKEYTDVDIRNLNAYIKNEFDKTTNINEYIYQVAIEKNMTNREKIVVLLSHFESYLHSKVQFENGIRIKEKFDRTLQNKKYTKETMVLSVILAIVRVVYANTEKGQFDRKLPHRNDILHNGTLDYTDEEIDISYNILLAYICIIDEKLK